MTPILANCSSQMILFILKSQPVKIAHQAGYYLLNGRWHSMKGKPAPKGAPVASHPHAAGQHAPAKHFTDEQWEQLKLPAENVNAGTYNKQLEQLKQHSEAGHVTGILGAGYGVNTYGKKLAHVANSLLSQHGSEHKVTPGQKAGTHPAVQHSADAAPVETKPAEPVAEAKPDPTPEPVKPEPEPEPKPEPEPAKAESSNPLAMPDFDEGKTKEGVKIYYEKQAQKVMALVNAGDVDGIHQMMVNGIIPNKKGKISNTWAGKTANSKKFIQFVLDAKNQLKASSAPAQPRTAKPEPVAPAAPTPAAAAPASGGFDFESHKLPDSNANAKSHNGKIDHLKKLHAAGDVAGLESFKAGVNTYGKKQMKVAAAAAEHLKQSKSAPAEEPNQKHDFTQWLQDGAPSNAAIQSAWHDLPDDEKLKHQEDAYGAETLMDSAIANAGSASEAKSIAEAYLDKHGHHPGNIGYVKSALKSAGFNSLINSMFSDAKPDEQPDTSKLAAAFKAAKEAEPQKPTKPILPSGPFFELGTKVEQAIDAKDLTKLAALASQTSAMSGDKAQAIAKYAKEGIAYLGASPQAEQGPHDGDTKPAADGGTLVFHDGHWHKQEEPKAAEPDPQVGGGLPSVPNFTGSGKPHQVATKIATELKHISDNQGHAEMMSHITQHKNGNFTIKAAGYNFKQMSPNSFNDTYKELHQYVSELIAASAAKAGKKPKAPKPKATSAAPKAATPAPGSYPSIDSWQQTGPQGGTNPGGKFKDENGVEWYCKFPADEDTAKAEVLAAKLYALAGVTGQEAKLISKGGKTGIASKWVDVSKADPATLSKTEGVISGFATDAWLGNWDVVGLSYDNLQVGSDGKAVRVDAGGSLMYRAQGGKKAFGDTVPELDSLIDPAINPQSAAVFGKMKKADLLASVSKVVNLSDSKIMAAVMSSGFGTVEERKKLAETLIARKKYLAEKFPKAVKEKKIVFKPEDISQPPDFLNWGSTGKSGPSSKEFLNQANHQAAQDIYQAAKTGSIEDVKSLKSPIYNKDTGEVSGAAPVLEHPSQHIKGYAQQVINEINYQLNPPKKFRFDGGHPLNSLNDSYPPYTGALSGDKVSKVAKFVSLGDPGTFEQGELGLPKITHKSGQLTQQTYAKQAQAAIAKMPATQRQAVQAYTGSGYHAINSSLWNGNPSGQAKSAAEALHTLAHDIAPGTLLSRKISVSGSDLHAILGSTGKILQEPAIMSTSIRPSSWGGNVQLKMTVGPGVKGLWVGYGSMSGGGALSNHASEDEMILPPNTRLMIISVKKSSGVDADGFGQHVDHVIEAIILPSEGY